MAKNKRQGPRRGEYCGRPSRKARLHTTPQESIPPQMDHAKAGIHGHPQYSPRRPSLPLRTCIHEPSSFGRHPPLGGGRMLAHSPFSTISPLSSPSTIIPEEPNIWLFRLFSACQTARGRDARAPKMRQLALAPWQQAAASCLRGEDGAQEKEGGGLGVAEGHDEGAVEEHPDGLRGGGWGRKGRGGGQAGGRAFVEVEAGGP